MSSVSAQPVESFLMARILCVGGALDGDWISLSPSIPRERGRRFQITGKLDLPPIGAAETVAESVRIYSYQLHQFTADDQHLFVAAPGDWTTEEVLNELLRGYKRD